MMLLASEELSLSTRLVLPVSVLEMAAISLT